MVVFGGHKNISVKFSDLRLPLYRAGVLARHPHIAGHFVEQRQVIIAQVNQFDRHVSAGLRLRKHPLRWLVGETGGAGRADDEGDFGFGHRSLHSG